MKIHKLCTRSLLDCSLGVAIGFAAISVTPVSVIANEPAITKSESPNQNAENDKSASSSISPQLVARAISLVPGNDPVIRELDVLDYQLEQIEALQFQTQKQLGVAMQSAAKLTGRQRQAILQAAYDQAYQNLEAILLPHQIERLLQITVQSLATSGSNGQLDLANLIANRAVQQQLQISSSKITELRKKIAEEQRIVRQEVEKIRAQSRQRILEVLSPSMRQQVDSMIGEKFDFQGYTVGPSGRFSKPADGDH